MPWSHVNCYISTFYILFNIYFIVYYFFLISGLWVCSNHHPSKRTYTVSMKTACVFVTLHSKRFVILHNKHFVVHLLSDSFSIHQSIHVVSVVVISRTVHIWNWTFTYMNIYSTEVELLYLYIVFRYMNCQCNILLI